jgi:RNA polymerase sigma-70 factor (ECF subfamily)
MAMADPPWEELYANLRGFVGRRVRNSADADDVVQRILLQIYKGLASVRDGERFHAWVYRTARNTIVDHYRSPALNRELPAGDATDLSLEGPVDGHAATETDDDAAFREVARCLTPLMRLLPAAQSEALTLTELHGLDQADAARQTGVSVSGMKSRVQRGRRQLKAALEQCCRLQLDRRGGVVAFEPRREDSCSPCGSCNDPATTSGASPVAPLRRTRRTR